MTEEVCRFLTLAFYAKAIGPKKCSLFALISKQIFCGSFVAGCGISGASK
jgi:hypothetical protein